MTNSKRSSNDSRRPAASEHPLRDLPPRGKTPNSKRTLEAWIDQAARRTGVINKRLGWLVASSVVVAALQRARDHDGHPRFLLKGGAYLESKLGLRARATADVDLLFRDNFDDHRGAEPGPASGGVPRWSVIRLDRRRDGRYRQIPWTTGAHEESRQI